MNDTEDLDYISNPIELLGYDKNNIVEVLASIIALPISELDFLKSAYKSLDKVQEYLYKH